MTGAVLSTGSVALATEAGVADEAIPFSIESL